MLESALDRLTSTAQLWVVNEVIHSWVDPVFATAAIVGIGYVVYRVVVWAMKEERSK